MGKNLNMHPLWIPRTRIGKHLGYRKRKSKWAFWSSFKVMVRHKVSSVVEVRFKIRF